MSQKILVLKPESLAVAYLVAPFAGMAALWACLTIYDVSSSGTSAIIRDLLIGPWLFSFEIFLCVIAEMIVITPLLAGFERYRWRWLNGWTACLLGFVVGALPAWFVGSMPIAGHMPGWTEAAPVSISAGLVGLTMALVFRLVAVEAKSEDLPV